jgi:pantoate--beta-alanine ligase
MSRISSPEVRSMPVRMVETIGHVRDHVARARKAGRSVGLVPTMGALHEGHARLIETCRDSCDEVVVSIFVNPTQFGPNDDYSRYPRSLEADLATCERAGASLVFVPSSEEIYPPVSETTYVEVPGLSDILEGASRPGHFRGVATVVLKLFGIVRPDIAYFGQKDYQQQLVLRRMVTDLNVPVRIETVPTVRESDGLALSSRNRYLNSEERRAATVLSRSLREAEAAVRAGERSAERVRQVLHATLESERLASVDYAEVADAETLEPLTVLGEGRRGVALLAVRVGPARLIDNAILPA